MCSLLKPINCSVEVYQMLQRIGKNENAFSNPVNGMQYEHFIKWVKQQEEWERGIGLPVGFVKQSIFCFWVDNKPVGIGKIRHELTPESRKKGGNIGYAVDPIERGKGLGNLLLKSLLNKAIELEIKEILLTVEKYNYASKKVIENNGGILLKENNQRWYFTIYNC